ncbi:MAG: endolytic transglycosylase MltG [Alphaproteobacteria bacterium]
MALIVLVGGVLLSLSFYRYYAPRDYIEGARTVMIAPGTGAKAILYQLHREGVIPPPWLILLPMLFEYEPRSFKAGEYQLPSGLSPSEVLGMIARGEILVHQITIPEGFALNQIRALLLAEPLLTGDLPPSIAEGTIFPETERFARGESRTAVVRRLQKHMQEKLDAAWAKRAPDLPFSTKEEAVILASIVERETGVHEERGRVAAVFINRLRAGMRLQSDPTVAYGVNLTRGDGTLRQLTTRDLQTDHPWNTYTRDGLPPTPIASPGLAAIEAVLNPPVTGEFYFVATGDGGHYFARTLNEHNQNVARYRQQLKSNE